MLIALMMVLAATQAELDTPPTTEPEAQPVLLDPAREKSWGYALLTGPLGVNLTFNLFNRTVLSSETYGTSPKTILRGLTNGWEWDDDAFSTNQLGHPYQGSLSFAAARGFGLDFWEGLAVATTASFVWEIAGEAQRPSLNDAITTPIGGAFLGEMLFRFSNRILDRHAPGFWRDAAVIGLTPTYGVSRLMNGDRYRPPGVADEPPLFLDLRIGAGRRGNFLVSQGDVSTEVQGFGETMIALTAVLGPPGGDWEFKRPFDHAILDASVSFMPGGEIGSNLSPSIAMRGIVLGDTFKRANWAGVWGLMGAYDFYSAGNAFQISTTSLGLGGTARRSVTGSLVFVGTGYLGAGFGTGAQGIMETEGREYRFGGVGSSLLEAGLVWADRVGLKLSARAYTILDSWEPDRITNFDERIAFGRGALIVRVWGNHAIGIESTLAQRTADYVGRDRLSYRHDNLMLQYIWTSEPRVEMGR